MEPKLLYRSVREDVLEAPERMPLGRARVPRRGDDLTLVAYGAMLPRTLEAAGALADEGLDCEVIDLVSLAPLGGDGRDAAEPRLQGRLELPLILGFDHRLNDGADAAEFANAIARSLGDPEQLLLAG